MKNLIILGVHIIFGCFCLVLAATEFKSNESRQTRKRSVRQLVSMIVNTVSAILYFVLAILGN